MSREFDVVVFGATGFTGRLVAEYLQNQYGDKLSWAMAGRSEDKLASVRAEMGVSENVPLITADSSDAASLKALAERTKSVCTTVGPYQLYGDGLLSACAAVGTDYVDLSGETAWMHDTIEKYSDAAKESGARIVHSCGFDSIPFDLGVYYAQQYAIKNHGGPCPKLRGCVRKMQGTFSGGTAASFMQMMKRAAVQPEVLDWAKDPFSLVPGFTGPAQPTGQKPIYEEDLGSWSAPFIMASINTKNVHRSNALLGHLYGQDFVYDEMVLTGPGEDGEKAANMMASTPMIGGENDPKPGEGPSKEERENGFYDALFFAEYPDGKGAVLSVKGDKDPGYGSTSKIISEAALTLIDTQGDGGVTTPGAALGDALVARLTAHAGLEFTLEG